MTSLEEERAIPRTVFEAELRLRWVFVSGAEQGLAVLRRVGDVGHISSLYVRPEARRQGHAGALLQRIRQVAEAEGLARLELSVFRDNHAAMALYRREGFDLTEVTPFGDREDCGMGLTPAR
ncbi:GNAT family N-acetyltransferase [Pseudoroseicyclus sp. H15]